MTALDSLGRHRTWHLSLTRFCERHSSTCFRAKLLSLAPRIRRATVVEGERSSPLWPRATARLVDGVDRIGPLPADGWHNTGPRSVVSACGRTAQEPSRTLIGVRCHATASCALFIGGDDRAVGGDGGDASPVEIRDSRAGTSNLFDTPTNLLAQQQERKTGRSGAWSGTWQSQRSCWQPSCGTS